MRGRKPTPTAIKIVRGNPGRRPLNAAEPQPSRGRPRKPAWLDGVADEAWAELVELLDGMRVLTVADGPALALLCATYQDYREARTVVRDEGMSYMTENEAGSTIHRPRPEFAMMSDAAKRLRSMMVEFGLTPSARSRVHAQGELPQDPLGDFLKGAAGA